MGEEAFKDTWFDRTHSYLTTMLCQPSVWFDGFFGQHRAGEDWAGSLIRWQNSVRLDEREKPEFRSEFSADFRFPKMCKKIKLVITSESEGSDTDIHPDDNPYDLGRTAADTDDNNRTTAGLRYYLTDSKKARLNIGGGVKLDNPTQVYIRFRLRYTEPIGKATLLRFTPTVVWLSKERFNRSLRIDLEQRISENVLFRASQSVVRKDLEQGVQWGSVLTLYDRVSPVTVLALEAGAAGTTWPDDRVERYELSARLRTNYLREWLFLEVEPEYYWPRDDQGEYHFFRAITFRIEMQFYS